MKTSPVQVVVDDDHHAQVHVEHLLYLIEGKHHYSMQVADGQDYRGYN